MSSPVPSLPIQPTPSPPSPVQSVPQWESPQTPTRPDDPSPVPPLELEPSHSVNTGIPSSPPHHSHSGLKRRPLDSSRTIAPVHEANEYDVLPIGYDQSRSIDPGTSGRPAAWTSNDNRLSPPTSPSFDIGELAGPKPPGGFRQTVLGAPQYLAPIPIELGKRAMEKIARSWGSRSNNPPGQSLLRGGRVSGLTPPPSYKGKFSEYINRNHPNGPGSDQPSPLPNSSEHKGRARSALSENWSTMGVKSLYMGDGIPTGSESEVASLNLGRSLRSPLSTGGAVFGRRLADCVRDTAVDDVKQKLLSVEGHGGGWNNDRIAPLQERLLPALVLRCAQYILAWGIQEEGLFRYALAITEVLGIKPSTPSSQDQREAVTRRSLACRV